MFSSALAKLEKSAGDISLSDSIEYCTNSNDGYLLVKNRIAILKSKNYPYISELENELERRKSRIIYLREIANKTEIRVRIVKEFDNSVDGGLEHLRKAKVDEIVNIVKGFTYKIQVMKILKIVLEDEDKFLDVQNRLSYKYSNLNKVDHFFLGRKTDTLRGLFDSVMADYEVQLGNTSSYVKDRLRDKELRVISFLEFIDEYYFGEDVSSGEGDCIVSIS